MEIKTRKLVSALSFLILLLPSLLKAQSTEDALELLLQSKSIDREKTAIFVWDLESDYPVVAHNSNSAIVPASVMKCVTTAALSRLMPYSERLSTKVFYSGNISGGNLKGNIIIEGTGDPSLSDNRHKGQPDFIESLIGALQSKGISSIEGEIVVSEDRFAGPAVPSSWSSTDLSQSYGTGFHAFNFEGNASGKKAVENPAAIFRRKLTGALADASIEFTETKTKSTNKRTPLLDYKSPPLSELMRSCMFRSDNLYAESFFRIFGVLNGTDGSAAMSPQVAMQHWDALSFPLEGVDIVDGSGLSRANRLTAEFLGSVLRSKAGDPEYLSFFPLVGEEGTVRNFMAGTPLQGRLALKTGSMNGIQSYAGYILDKEYMPTYVVVIMTNDLKNRSEFRAVLTRFFQSIVD